MGLQVGRELLDQQIGFAVKVLDIARLLSDGEDLSLLRELVETLLGPHDLDIEVLQCEQRGCLGHARLLTRQGVHQPGVAGSTCTV